MRDGVEGIKHALPGSPLNERNRIARLPATSTSAAMERNSFHRLQLDSGGFYRLAWPNNLFDFFLVIIDLRYHHRVSLAEARVFSF